MKRAEQGQLKYVTCSKIEFYFHWIYNSKRHVRKFRITTLKKVGKMFILSPLDSFFFLDFSSPLALDIKTLKPSRFREISSTVLSSGL